MAEDIKLGTQKEMYIDESAMEVMKDTLGDFLQASSVEAVYGEPIKEGETLIVPAAEVLAVMAFGAGSGYGKGRQEGPEERETDQEAITEEEYTGEGGGSGGGGGGRILSRPAAVVVISPEGVRVEPVVDITKIALAALTASGFILGMLFRMMNPKRALRDM
jgi:uncharacterized spore protein YtfJ